ncbi:hypothetical protein EGR_06436 [Echinococcus granulosus]|uniref:Secreted protein n=1 Tax=Echinococcus granulosus TaxID=6210 RepID=W6UC51_ECHGR|nr:hypothetical protein EGR_06436 [Echinococcus granulosus]EUB58765.1 hypothetical protein EGR_06436 [Echinococcus granulosus]
MFSTSFLLLLSLTPLISEQVLCFFCTEVIARSRCVLDRICPTDGQSPDALGVPLSLSSYLLAHFKKRRASSALMTNQRRSRSLHCLAICPTDGQSPDALGVPLSLSSYLLAHFKKRRASSALMTNQRRSRSLHCLAVMLIYTCRSLPCSLIR